MAYYYPPIDWAKVQTADDFPREYGYRDPSMVRLIEREVLSKGRRALIIIGGHHLLRHSPVDNFQPRAPDKASIGDAFEHEHSGQLFTIWTVVGETVITAKLSQWPVGSLGLVRLMGIASMSSEVIFGTDIVVFRMVNGERQLVTLKTEDFPPLSEQIDAVLYLGDQVTTMEAPPSVYSDEGYVAELRRRARILEEVFGYDYGAKLDTLINRWR